MRVSFCALLSLMLSVCVVAGSFDPEAGREIFPIPRVVEYRSAVVPIPDRIMLAAGGSFSAEKVGMMAGDLGEYLSRRCGRAMAVSVAEGTTQPTGFRIVLVDLDDVPEGLRGELLSGPFVAEKLPGGLRRDQSFIIRSFLGEAEPTVYLISPSEQGIYYALFAWSQLVRVEEGRFTVRGVDLIDWPAFEARVTSDVNGLKSDMPVEQQRMFIHRKAGLQRISHGFYGYGGYTNQQAYALARGLRLGYGYWERPKLESPLAAWNWSDPNSIRGYAELAGNAVADPSMGLYVWHDATDAGWWFEYVQDFWAERDAVDRANYPDDPTPARADAARFAAMLEAIRQSNANADVFLTLPCYYEAPNNDALPDINHFREYLRVVGQSVPQDMKDRFYFVLEDRTPEQVAGYHRYLGTKLCNFRYTPLWNGGTWDTNYTDAKRHDGTIESYFYDVAHVHLDLINVIASQYLWNPDVPTDEAWIISNLAPRAAWLAYGPAWREMVQYFALNLNGSAASRETDMGELDGWVRKADQADEWLTEAEKKIPPTWSDARCVADVAKGCVASFRRTVRTAIEAAGKPIALDGVTFRVDDAADGKLVRSGDTKGQWDSSGKGLPCAMEIELPQAHQVSRILIRVPNAGGYSLQRIEVQAMIAERWKTVGQMGELEREAIFADFADLQTDRIKLIVHSVWVTVHGEMASSEGGAGTAWPAAGLRNTPAVGERSPGTLGESGPSPGQSRLRSVDPPDAAWQRAS